CQVKHVHAVRKRTKREVAVRQDRGHVRCPEFNDVAGRVRVTEIERNGGNEACATRKDYEARQENSRQQGLHTYAGSRTADKATGTVIENRMRFRLLRMGRARLTSSRTRYSRNVRRTRDRRVSRGTRPGRTSGSSPAPA